MLPLFLKQNIKIFEKLLAKMTSLTRNERKVGHQIIITDIVHYAGTPLQCLAQQCPFGNCDTKFYVMSIENTVNIS